ncbi:MAG: formylglycine-generating enzyme family protein [Bacteroidetes bacterium]|nr:formylglycine-generating enzyme family protein [Bacteroidota bacterium]
MKRYLILIIGIFFLTGTTLAQTKKTSKAKRLPIDTSKFVLVQAGKFSMGTDKPVEPQEGPVHEVQVNSFWIGKTEVTTEDYDKFLLDNQRDTMGSSGWGRGKQPAIFVSWDDAVAYCNWLSAKEKLSKYYYIDTTGKVICRDTAKGYRLPTEAEWEFAARGGNSSKGFEYAGSKNMDEVVWYKSNGNRAMPVGRKMPNELGIFDMNGNVWEWVWDIYSRDYYSHSPANDPRGAETGLYRVMRGGAFYNTPQYCRIVTRQNSYVNFRQNSVGFRLARTYYP